MILENNWQTSFYALDNRKAYLALSGYPLEDGGSAIGYTLLVSSKDNTKDYLEKEFKHLSDALELVNQDYGHWEFSDLAIKTDSGSGCSSCEAH